MNCPYCGSQNPDDAVVCSSCNAVLVEGAQPQAFPLPGAGDAAFQPDPSGNPSAPYAPGPADTPGNPNAPYAPGPYGGPGMPPAQPSGPAPAKNSKTRLILAIVLGAVALIAIIVAIVAFVTCTGNTGRPNLDSLVKDEPEKVAKYLENLEIVKISDDAYYTPPDMKDLISKAGKAFDEGSRNAVGKIHDDIKDQNLWAIALYEEEKGQGTDGYKDFKNLKYVNIQEKGADPCEAIYISYRVLDNPTPDDIFKIVQEVVTVDELALGSEPTQEGQKNYDQNIYFGGVGEGPDTTLYVRVNKLDDVYEIVVIALNTDEIDGKGLRFIDSASEHLSKNFEEEDDFPKKK